MRAMSTPVFDAALPRNVSVSFFPWALNAMMCGPPPADALTMMSPMLSPVMSPHATLMPLVNNSLNAKKPGYFCLPKVSKI